MTAKIRSGETPRSCVSNKIRPIMTLVFPVPGPASTRRLLPWNVTACLCSWFNDSKL